MIRLKTIIIFLSVNSYNKPHGQKIQFPSQPVNIVPQKTLTKTREPVNPSESTETEESWSSEKRINFGRYRTDFQFYALYVDYTRLYMYLQLVYTC